MLKYNMACTDRKDLVKRIEELTGLRSRYTYVPRCAYVIGAYAVEKNGDLVVSEEDVNEDIIRSLQEGGFLAGGITAQQAAELPAREELEAAASEKQPEAPAGIPGGEQLSSIPTSGASVVADREDNSQFPMDVSISVPLERHTGTTLKNLINMMYSRGALISKAVGGHFYVAESIVDALEENNPIRAADVKSAISGLEDGLVGIRLEDDRLVFDGFTEVPSAEHLQTFTRLVTLMNQMALTQKRIQAKDVDDSNEKYALRIWLIRLGMVGDEYKADRKILTKNLSGHTAFRTADALEKAKQKALRQKELASTQG